MGRARRSRASAAWGLALALVCVVALTARPERAGAVSDSRWLDLRIVLAEDEWDQLRKATPPQGWGAFGASCHPFNHDFHYAWQVARVELDGQRLEGAAIRKKAYCGSENADRPALKLRWGPRGARARLTLNNSLQDASWIRQCLAYDLFDWAGLPSSACSWAEVRVNGGPPEIYVVVEAIDRRYAERQGLTDAQGSWPRFEGTRSDFHPDWVQNFEAKHGSSSAAVAQLQLAAAMWAVMDERPLSSQGLAQHFDVEQWLTYWALESLAGAWDGYTRHQNNFYLGLRASDDRWLFLPWGTDHYFRHVDAPLMPVAAWLPWRLRAEPWALAAYCRAMEQLLVEVWHEGRILADIDAWAREVEGRLRPVHRARFIDNLGRLRRFVAERRTHASVELEQLCVGRPGREASSAAPALPRAERVGAISIEFELPWQRRTVAAAALEAVRLSGHYEGQAFEGTVRAASVGGSHQLGAKQTLSVSFAGRGEVSEFNAVVALPGGDLQVAGRHAIDYTARGHGGLVAIVGGQRSMVARFVDGELVLDQPGSVPGAPVAGVLRAKLLRIAVP